jgi:hypothetical protein
MISCELISINFSNYFSVYFQNDAVTVVLYNMFDTYVEIGEAKIVSSDVAKGENFDDSSKTIFLIICFFTDFGVTY